MHQLLRLLTAGCLAASLFLSPTTLLAITRAESEAPPVSAGTDPAPAEAPDLTATAALEESPALRLEGLRPFSPEGAPFGAAGRHDLARDALTFFVRQQGNFPGRAVFQLPVPTWWTAQGLEGEGEAPPEVRSWDMRVPASLPIYLLAAVDPSGWLDPEATSVTVDGVPLPGLERYIHQGVPAVSSGQLREMAVLDLVFAPPRAGRYRVEVRSSPPAAPPATAVYDLTVGEADGLGPQVLRAGDGALYAVLGSERLRVPDVQTVTVFGFAPADVVPAAPETLASFSEGPPLPALREGMVVRAPGSPLVFRLEGGRRVRDRELPASRAVEVHGPALNSVPPVLLDGMVVEGGTPDVFLVEGAHLRKVPDWVWLLMRGHKPEEAVRVPERILVTLPQNSPQWRIPGGAHLDRAFFSPVLGRSMPYRVFLPPSYDAVRAEARRYPVVYLLHGMGGRFDEWSGYGVEEVANQLLADGDLAEAIFVLPQGGLGYWMNQDGPGATPWAEYVARDLVRHVDATYRTVARREARAVGGLSMGGHGAVQLALSYPDLFGVAGVHSPSIRGRDSAPAYFGSDEAAFARRDPISLVREADLAAPPSIWIDVGEDDPWRPGAEALRQALDEKGWAHEWQVFPGEHDGWYWGDHLWEYLPYYTRAFRQQGTAP
jgi:endo-1,4-beta-xylanase